jgi:hypothetical protein
VVEMMLRVVVTVVTIVTVMTVMIVATFAVKVMALGQCIIMLHARE